MKALWFKVRRKGMQTQIERVHRKSKQTKYLIRFKNISVQLFAATRSSKVPNNLPLECPILTYSMRLN